MNILEIIIKCCGKMLVHFTWSAKFREEDE